VALVVGFDGLREQVDWQCSELERLAGACGGREAQSLPADAWPRLAPAARAAFPVAAAVMAFAVLPSQVAEVMAAGVVTVSPDEPVEAAARLLAEHGVGCLPVLLDDRLVGILTKADLLRVLLRVLGVLEPSSRITLVLPDVPGALGRAMTVVGDLGVNLISVVTEPGPEPGTRGVVLRAGTINAAPVVSALAAAGFAAHGPGQPGPPAR